MDWTEGASFCFLLQRTARKVLGLVLFCVAIHAWGCWPYGPSRVDSPMPAASDTSESGVVFEAVYSVQKTGVEERVSTGIALVDLNGDQFSDLIVSSGNDIAKNKVVVYPHTRDPQRPFDPDSAYSIGVAGFHTHLCVGDVNHDGFLDLGVARPWGGEDNRTLLGGVDVYLNRQGVLHNTPDKAWSVKGYAAFDCEFGDLDHDGKLDLAVAAFWGEDDGYPPDGNLSAYFGTILSADKKEDARVYRNTGEGFGSQMWSTAFQSGYMSVAIADPDRDGDLDLVLVGNYVEYYESATSDGGAGLPNTYTLRSQEPFEFPFGLEFVDLGDGFDRVLVGSGGKSRNAFKGRFELYDLVSKKSRPAWCSDTVSFPAYLGAGDFNVDGQTDFVGGFWGPSKLDGPLAYYCGGEGGFSVSPTAVSRENYVPQAVSIGTVDRWVEGVESRVISGAGVIRLPDDVEGVRWVEVGGKRHENWAWSPRRKWVSLAGLPSGSQVKVYVWKRASVHVAVANYTKDEPDYIYEVGSFPGQCVVEVPVHNTCRQPMTGGAP